MESKRWHDLSKRLLKSELVKRGISHDELAQKLIEIGVKETKSSIDSKICRGTFSASFLLQCLHVIGCEKLTIEHDLFETIESYTQIK